MRRLSVGFAAFLALSKVDAQRYFKLTTRYPASRCEDPPTFVEIEESTGCAAVSDYSDWAPRPKTSVTCSSEVNHHSDLKNLFGGSPFILRESYADANCTTFEHAKAFEVDGTCVPSEIAGLFMRGRLGDNKLIRVQYFLEDSCSEGSFHHSDYVEREVAGDHSCDQKPVKWYARTNTGRLLAKESSWDGGTEVGSTDEEPDDDAEDWPTATTFPAATTATPSIVSSTISPPATTTDAGTSTTTSTPATNTNTEANPTTILPSTNTEVSTTTTPPETTTDANTETTTDTPATETSTDTSSTTATPTVSSTVVRLVQTRVRVLRVAPALLILLPAAIQLKSEMWATLVPVQFSNLRVQMLLWMEVQVAAAQQRKLLEQSVRGCRFINGS